MTSLIAFHQSHSRTLKASYLEHLCQAWRAEFPRLVSYSRFVEDIPAVLVPLCAYLESCRGVDQLCRFDADCRLQ